MVYLKTSLLFLSLALLLSCADNDNIVRKQVSVNIYEVTVPETGTLNQDIQIKLKAQAINGCYSNLIIQHVAIDNRHFQFKATAWYRSDGACPENIVETDTTILFTPTATGKYFFQTNEDPFEIRNDTITIK